MGEGGPSLKLFFPAFLHNLIAEGGREEVRWGRGRAIGWGSEQGEGKDAGEEQQPGASFTPSLLLTDVLGSFPHDSVQSETSW